MEENNQRKVSLKTVIIIIMIIAILIIGIVIIIKGIVKDNKTFNSNPNSNEIKETDEEETYICNEDIKSITIKYYEGYYIASGDAIYDNIPLNTINLESDDLKEISKLIKGLTKFKYSEDDEISEHIHHQVVDKYKLEINDNFIIYIASQYGKVAETEDDYFKVPEELYNKISEIAQNYNNENLYKKINSTKITIISGQEKLEVTNEAQLNRLSNFQYYVTNVPDEVFENEEVIYTLDLNDGRKIDIYLASILSCIYYEDGTHEYIYTGMLENYVKQIFNDIKEKIEKSKVDLETGIVNKIIVTYKNREYIIDDKDKISEILEEFKNLEYFNIDNFKSSLEEELNNKYDIHIYVNNTEYIIHQISRFYIDKDGKLYNVSELSNLEEYFKELVNYGK